MRNKSLTIWVVVLVVSLFGLTKTYATIFDDGGIHDVNSDLTAELTAEIKDTFEDAPTTVNLQSDGKMGSVAVFDSSLFNMYGGTITHLSIFNESQANLYAGIIEWSVAVRDSSRMTIHDGATVYSINCRDTGKIDIFGGSIGDALRIESKNASVSITGYDFIFDGNSVMGEVVNTSNETKSGYLAGSYLDGAPIGFDIVMYPDTSIVFIPEPATLLLLGLGAVILRK